ncbi:MAG: hypothetical protein PHI66_01755 [Candidatus Pacebacteria bacterium]|nr:hypothetical protein [Candidatus Paceibacterota bacterium]
MATKEQKTKKSEDKDGAEYEKTKTVPKKRVVAKSKSKTPAQKRKAGAEDKKAEMAVDEMQNPGTESGQGGTFLKWRERDFFRSSEEKYLYYASAFLSFIAIVWNIKSESWISALTFLLLLVVVIFELKEETKETEYEINIDGISIGGRLYRFAEIGSFEIVKKGELDVVKLQMKNSIFPTREVYLPEGQDLVYMQALLEYFLPGKVHEETLFNFKEDKKLTEEELIDKKVDEFLKERF